MLNIKNTIDELKSKINQHNKFYYVNNKPIISDQEYDILMQELIKLEKENPNLLTPDSPSMRVGSDIKNQFKTILHDIPMLSISNTYSKDELIYFDKRIKKQCNNIYTYVCELKIDGVSISLIYENGLLIRAITRGDGNKGEDVTANVKTIKNLPLKINYKEKLEIRGEIFFSHNDFEQLNIKKIEQGDTEFANARNASSGTLKLLDSRLVSQRKLSIFCYRIIKNNVTNQYDALKLLKQLKFPTNPLYKLCKNINEVIEYCNDMQKIRSTLHYDIDGVVVKLNDFNQQQQLGETSHHPKWTVAFKFPAEQVITRLKDITIQVGRTGKLTPVAELEPIKLAGSTISRATLHNYNYIHEKDIQINDNIVLEKAGEIIPQVVKSIVADRVNHLQFHMPKKCPVCDCDIIKDEDKADFYCPNHTKCPAQLQGSIEHFVSRDAMDIEGLGPSVIKQLLDKGLIKDYADLYYLDKNDLSKLDRFGEKSIQNLLKAINDSKNRDLYRLIYGLGIRQVGLETAKELADKYKHIDDMRQVLLSMIDEHGYVAMRNLYLFFDSDYSTLVLHKLRLAKVNFMKIENNNNGNKFEGKTFVFTGALQKYKRSQASEIVKNLGGNVAGSISKKVTHVVVGNDAGSKLEKANKLGLITLTEEEFDKIIGEN